MDAARIDGISKFDGQVIFHPFGIFIVVARVSFYNNGIPSGLVGDRDWGRLVF
jgi:hypothetical protein